MHTIQAVLFLALVTGISVYDHHKRHVPNSVTLTLLFGGMLAYFPGEVATWLGCALLFVTWRLGGMGGGDAKLWMGVLWLVPPHQASIGVSVMLVSFLMTAILQMGWRKFNGHPLTGVQSPGAWRVIPFAAWFLLAGIHVY
jgi:Flp pilus assembly protein protease CpaA